MCFSATASFGAGVALSAMGIATLRKTNNRSQVAFATVPLIFGVQQISEGFLWLSLSDPSFESLRLPMTYFFLAIAQVVWPFWVPFSLFRMEQDLKRRTILKLFTVVAAIVSAGFAFHLVAYPVDGRIDGCHIDYVQDYPDTFRIPGVVLYLLCTIVAIFISSVRHMWILGITIAFSYLAALIFYEEYVVSVWCFFAALISLVIYFLIPRRHAA